MKLLINIMIFAGSALMVYNIAHYGSFVKTSRDLTRKSGGMGLLIVPLLLHGTYDFFAMTMQFDQRFMLLFFAFLAGLYLVGTQRVNRSAQEDRRVEPEVMQRFYPDVRPPWQE